MREEGGIYFFRNPTLRLCASVVSLFQVADPGGREKRGEKPKTGLYSVLVSLSGAHAASLSLP